MSVKEFGKYVVADPEICHGALTFRGTRLFVADILEQVADGDDWDKIIADWHHSITKEAIAEAVNLARTALFKHIDEFVLESQPA